MIRLNDRRKTKTAKLGKMMTRLNDRRLANSAELGKMMHHLVEYGLYLGLDLEHEMGLGFFCEVVYTFLVWDTTVL